MVSCSSSKTLFFHVVCTPARSHFVRKVFSRSTVSTNRARHSPQLLPQQLSPSIPLLKPGPAHRALPLFPLPALETLQPRLPYLRKLLAHHIVVFVRDPAVLLYDAVELLPELGVRIPALGFLVMGSELGFGEGDGARCVADLVPIPAVVVLATRISYRMPWWTCSMADLPRKPHEALPERQDIPVPGIRRESHRLLSRPALPQIIRPVQQRIRLLRISLVRPLHGRSLHLFPHLRPRLLVRSVLVMRRKSQHPLAGVPDEMWLARL